MNDFFSATKAAPSLSYALLALLSLLLGVMLFGGLLNRLLNFFHDKMNKRLVGLLLLLFFMLLFGGLGLALAPALGLVVAAFVLAAGFGLAALGEGRHWAVRRKMRAEAPTERRGIKSGWLRPVTTTDLQILNYRVGLAGWQGKPFRVVHLSDLHFHEKIAFKYYQSAIEHANQAEPDLIFITGDFLDDLSVLPKLGELLRGLRSRWGVFGVLGNHDYWSDPRQVTEIAQANGVQMLGQGWRRVDTNGGHELVLLGCEAPWSRKRCDLTVLPESGLRIALSHSPDYVYQFNQAGVQAVFAGHTHAGQFHLPGFGPLLMPSRYGRRFYGGKKNPGHFNINGTHLFISSGLGCAKPTLRLYCPPDLAIIDFLPALPANNYE
jgi:predicted MPP superfamily phosphohydrolase